MKIKEELREYNVGCQREGYILTREQENKGKTPGNKETMVQKYELGSCGQECNLRQRGTNSQTRHTAKCYKLTTDDTKYAKPLLIRYIILN